MRTPLSLLLALAILFVVPFGVLAAPAAPQNVVTFQISPDPAPRPLPGMTRPLNVTVDFEYNDSGDYVARFCLYVPTGVTASEDAVLNIAGSGFDDPTPLTFTPSDGAADCPFYAGYDNPILYTSAVEPGLEGTHTISGSFTLMLSDSVVEGGYSYRIVLEEPAGAATRTTSHTVAAPLSVRLESFTAGASTDAITVEWVTASEENNLGFNLYRSTTLDAPTTQLSPNLIASQMPGSSQGAHYEWTDSTAAPGVTYYYWLEDMDADGTLTMSGPVSATLLSPTAIQLGSISTRAASPAAPPLAAVALVVLAGLALVRHRR